MRLAILWLLAGAALAAQTTPAVSVTTAARSVQPGEVVLLTVSGLSPADSARARVFGRWLPLFPAGQTVLQALVGIDLDVRPGTYPIGVEVSRATGPPTLTNHVLVVRTKAFPTRTLTVDPRFVEPPAEVQLRIAEEARLLARLFSASSPRTWSGPFVRPVPDPANSAFGSRSVFNGQPRSPHGGADFSSPTGRPILAPNSGLVVLARDLYFTGQTVVVDHGLGLVSLFAHLSAIGVEDGSVVKTGDVLGQVGATGRVTGPHLHWTVRLAEARVDPLSLLAATELMGTERAEPSKPAPGERP